MPGIIDEDHRLLLEFPVVDHFISNASKEIFQISETCFFNYLDVHKGRTQWLKSFFSSLYVFINLGDVAEAWPAGILTKFSIVPVFDDDPVFAVWNEVCWFNHVFLFIIIKDTWSESRSKSAANLLLS